MMSDSTGSCFGRTWKRATSSSKPIPPSRAWRRPEISRQISCCYDANFDVIAAATLRAAASHPEFGPVVRGMSSDQLEQERQRSRENIRRAVAGEWLHYEGDLRMQGTVYARMGVSFAGWYDLVRGFQHHIVPLLVAQYGDDRERLVRALNGMQGFLDRAMVIIGQQYVTTKEDLAAEHRELARQSEERHRSLFDGSPVPMWVYDRQTLKFLAVNRAAVDHYGFSESEFLTMTIDQIRPPESPSSRRACSAKRATSRSAACRW